jgi:hypothetical protein
MTRREIAALAVFSVALAAGAAWGEELWSLSPRSGHLRVASYETNDGTRVLPGKFSELTLKFKQDRLAVALTQGSSIRVEQDFDGEYDLLLTLTNMQCRVGDRAAARCWVAVRYASNSPDALAYCWYAMTDGSQPELIKDRDCPRRFHFER